MNARRVIAILLKDLRDTWRDGRIVALLLLPIGIALIPSIGGDGELPTAQVVIVDRGGTGVAGELSRAAGKSVELDLTQARDAAAARRLVADGDAEVAILLERPSASGRPRAEILVATDASPPAQSVVTLVPDVLTRAAGRSPTAVTQVRAVVPTSQEPIDTVEPREVTVLMSIVLLVIFVAMMVVPIQTGEEIETGTFGALRLAATAPEILAAKAITGALYASAGVGLTIVLTGLDVADPLLFYGAAFALIVCLVGFGLLLGLLIPNSNAINTYGGFLVFPLLAVVVAVFFAPTRIVGTILDVLPFSQATRLLGNGLTPEAPFHPGMLAWVVIAAWAAAGYASLVRIAARREI
jgi:hypothetical protein